MKTKVPYRLNGKTIQIEIDADKVDAYTKAMRKSSSNIRKFNVRKKVTDFTTDLGGDDYEFEFADDTSDVEPIAESEDIIAKVQSILHLLSDEQRRIVDLKFYQQYTDTEISRILGLSRQAVQNRLQRIYDKLKKKL